MKTLFLNSLVAILFATVAKAQSLTATQGLEKFKQNADIAQKNKVEVERNSLIVNTNVSEVRKVKEANLNQKKNLSSELNKNTAAIKKLNEQEKELNSLLSKEKDKLAIEDKQMQQLQLLMIQVKQNQEQRSALINDYQNQLNNLGLKKNEWKEREQKLKNQETKNGENTRTVASEEEAWQNKKIKYDQDLKYWTAEATRHQKIHDTYQGIAEGK